ncbi:MAG: 2-oxoglutarate dehydrogenase E1 component [Alphaproteobacteria bacterium]|nr:2-oxoglutarate dehydrogenase E1 component [Alphaproteobacteria bacterium]
MSQEASNISFLTGVSAEYIAHLYTEFLSNPSNVDESWQEFFGDLADKEVELLSEMTGASWTPKENRKSERAFGNANDDLPAHGTEAAKASGAKSAPSGQRAKGGVSSDDVKQAANDSIGALMLIRAYRARGHMLANLDPLGLKEVAPESELDPAHYGFSKSDYNRPIFINGVLGKEYATLSEIIEILKETYCGTIGVEFLHLTDPKEKAWVQERIEEPRNKTDFTETGKRAILQRMIAGEKFEQFLHKKYPGTKRFGVDGGEALIPLIEQIMKRGGQMGLEEMVIGMAHRGRLNVLANVMGKSFTAIFVEFQGQSSTPDDVLGSGDVKYHMGTSSDRDFDGNNIHLSLTANPSHLEFVNPVVIGKVRAKQLQRDDVQSISVMPLILHGDAAFAGQGITAETLMISELPGYRVGGTVHIVINNQIGFTTMPKYSRSGPYSTDVAKMLAAPIFHVNGDDPEAVVHVARIATEFRQEFKRDVVIDMFCYRRFGHNEGDEPAFTQPIMYQKISEQKTSLTKYAEQLVGEKVVTQDEFEGMVAEFEGNLEDAFKATESYKPNEADFLAGVWSDMRVATEGPNRGETGVDEDVIQKVGRVITAIPAGFNINKKLKRVIDARAKMLETGEGFDWAMGETLAYATLLDEGYPVRLSGQDVGRGTFSHRHAIWYDQETNEQYYPLKTLTNDDPKFEAHDSPLSEMAVLGFEYGYSLADPKTLTIWEAQFGDFVNGAQVMIDQFISSGESKWLRMSGLVMLLPHGYEGQGPEHSSARPERFLQQCAEDNWQVVNCTTPANFFHALRRQMHRDFRKPLIVFTPKSLLRHKLAVSDIDMFTKESTFHRVLWDDDRDSLVKADKIKRVILCTGKVYYDLLAERRERGIDDIRILRLEQLYPFPGLVLAEELAGCKNADIVWCQEEPENQGAWQFVDRRIENVLTKLKHKASRPKYVGRVAAAAPATGLMSRHLEEQKKLVDEALTV